jgi:transposase
MIGAVGGEMAAAKKYSVEQIIAKLREVERLQGQGMAIPAAAKKIGITDQTFYRWRLRYGVSGPPKNWSNLSVVA